MFPLRSLNEAFLSWDAANDQQRLNDPALCDPDQDEEEVGEGEDTPRYTTEVEYRE
jgi:hypothetical protein